MENVDYILVGQGIAGSLLAYELLKRGFSVKIIDNSFRSSSSIVAAGILNPITGQRLVKSWELEKFLPIAKLFYKELELHLDASFFNEREILRLFKNDYEVTQYHKRKTDEAYIPYLGDLFQPGTYCSSLCDQHGSFIIKQAANLNMKPLLLSLRDFFKEKNVLIEDEFHYNDIVLNNSTVSYKELISKKIIFCEGYKVIENPWFNDLKWEPAKGEILTLKIQEPLPNKIINAGKWLMPVGDNLYKAGASYSWDNLNCSTTEEGRKEVLDGIRNEILVNNVFQVVHQEAGVRPSTKDFKPYIGLHSTHYNIAIFNGFGSKGSLMVPYYAKQLADFLEKGLPLDDAVSLNRK